MKATVRLLLLGCLVFWEASSAWAVIIKGGDGTGNTSAPADDPGWTYVGRVNGSSGVYLGDGWVITAAHVGIGSTATFGTTSYDTVSGSWHRLHNPSIPTQVVDLGLFQLEENPAGLNDLSISNAAPANGSAVLGVGYGKDRMPTETWWNSNWKNETPLKAYSGFYWDTSHNSKRWGTNNILGTTEDDYGYGLTSLLITDFSQFGGDNEMQAAQNDSGGGVFYKRDSSWELTGIMLAIGVYTDQPSETAVYGNETYLADLSQYRSEIMTVIVPETPLPGDANLDGTVDLLDLGEVGDNWLQTGMAWADGDFNGDEVVDLLDLGIVGDNWREEAAGMSFGSAMAAADITLPEPSSLVLLATGLTGLLCYAWRKRK